ncbi:MAG: hypothetical protein JSW25_03015 [Thermoplasmata archaeon]|nr:MAG: hypothetical protein JSW25_03015 [Thermoplasmata archaeon]
MDPGVTRYFTWWGTALIALGLVFIGTFGYLWINDDLNWYRAEVVDNRDIQSMDVGDYVRVEGTVALNASEDLIITQVQVEKVVWEVDEYEYNVDWIWVTDDRGDPVLVIFDFVPVTKPGAHDGDYHVADPICVGGHVTDDGSGIMRVRAAFVAKHSNDTPAIFWQFFVAAIVVGLVLLLLFVLTRMFLFPRKQEAPDWRGL